MSALLPLGPWVPILDADPISAAIYNEHYSSEKGWPQRIPTMEEAAQIYAVRAQILAVHGLGTPYTSAELVRERIAELHDAERLKEAA